MPSTDELLEMFTDLLRLGSSKREAREAADAQCYDEHQRTEFQEELAWREREAELGDLIAMYGDPTRGG